MSPCIAPNFSCSTCGRRLMRANAEGVATVAPRPLTEPRLPMARVRHRSWADWGRCYGPELADGIVEQRPLCNSCEFSPEHHRLLFRQ